MEAQNYELMVITAAGAGAEPILAKVEKSIKEAGTSNLKVEKLGKKVLAYPIAKQTEGEFALFNFEAPGETIGAVLKMLRLEREAILRYLVLRVPRVSRVSREKEGVEETKAKVTVTTKTGIKRATKVSPSFAEASEGKKVSKGKIIKGKKGK